MTQYLLPSPAGLTFGWPSSRPVVNGSESLADHISLLEQRYYWLLARKSFGIPSQLGRSGAYTLTSAATAMTLRHRIRTPPYATQLAVRLAYTTTYASDRLQMTVTNDSTDADSGELSGDGTGGHDASQMFGLLEGTITLGTGKATDWDAGAPMEVRIALEYIASADVDGSSRFACLFGPYFDLVLAGQYQSVIEI